MSTEIQYKHIERKYYVPEDKLEAFMQLDGFIKDLLKGDKATMYDLYYGKQLMMENRPGWACGAEKARLIREKICTVESRFTFKPRKK